MNSFYIHQTGMVCPFAFSSLPKFPTPKTINLYLDDLRPISENFERVYSFEEFTAFITENGLPDFISFDHDLDKGKTGFNCAKWLVAVIARRYNEAIY